MGELIPDLVGCGEVFPAFCFFADIDEQLHNPFELFIVGFRDAFQTKNVLNVELELLWNVGR